MRLSDLVKKDRPQEGSKEEQEETQALPKTPPGGLEASEDTGAEPPRLKTEPPASAAQKDRLSLSRILSSREREEEASAARETPLSVRLEDWSPKTPGAAETKTEQPPSPSAGAPEGRLPPAEAPPRETPLALPPVPPEQGPPGMKPGPARGTQPPEEKARWHETEVERPRSHAPPAIGPEEGHGLYGNLTRALVELLQGVGRKERLRLEPLLQPVETLVSSAPVLEEFYRLALSTRGEGNALSDHLVHVATFAVKIGMGLRMPEPRLKRLALAALLHDIGMCMVPPELRHKQGKLTAQETAQIQRHPDYGYQIIKAHLGDQFLWLAEVIRQEHERENGAGYPRGLSGDAIDEMAKTIAVADVYEALTHDRPQRPRLLPYRAVREIMEKTKGQFSPRVLKAGLQQISVFPLNSLVRLNSNAVARVVETHEGQPLRPTVRILYDPKGDYVGEGRVLSLRENPLLYIVDSVDESEISPH